MRYSTIQLHPWYNRRHHRPDRPGYHNVWGDEADVPFWKAAEWMLRHRFQQKTNVPPSVQLTEPQVLAQRPERLRLTWIGHATVLVQTPRHNLLFDPIFSRRASPLSFAGPARVPELPLHVDELPAIDAVFLSHDHYDHLDKDTLTTLHETHAPLFVTPMGVAPILADWGLKHTAELDWWQHTEADGLGIHCTPAKHFSGRTPFNRDETLWAGWYLELPDADTRLYFAGDSGYAPHFAQIREQLGAPDLALIPIGAYRPRWLMQRVHVDPTEALRAFVDVGAREFVPIHWGTFDLAEEPIQEPPQQLRALAEQHGLLDRIRLLTIGAPTEWTEMGGTGDGQAGPEAAALPSEAPPETEPTVPPAAPAPDFERFWRPSEDEPAADDDALDEAAPTTGVPDIANVDQEKKEESFADYWRSVMGDDLPPPSSSS